MGVRLRLEIDFGHYPAARIGDAQFDVPLSHPLGQLKKALRSILRGFPQVECAYLLIYSDPAWGDAPQPIVSLIPAVETRQLYSSWKSYIPEFGPVAFFGGVRNRFSAFVSRAATPFYDPAQSSRVPLPFSKTGLIEYIRVLPDVPVLAATAAYLDTLKENYDELPPQEAAVEYAAQQLEMEHVIQALRYKSTHQKAKTALLKYLTANTPFGLVLRSFTTETTTGRSPIGDFRKWMLKHPRCELLSRFSPLPLIGIANPADPFPLSTVLLVECSIDWLRVVRSLIEVAAKIYVLCDRSSPGIANEFLAIQIAEREDDTFVLLPGTDQNEYYRDLYSLTSQTEDPGPVYTELLRRKLATFGLTVSTDELTRCLG